MTFNWMLLCRAVIKEKDPAEFKSAVISYLRDVMRQIEFWVAHSEVHHTDLLSLKCFFRRIWMLSSKKVDNLHWLICVFFICMNLK